MAMTGNGNGKNTQIDKTQETDLLMTILHELRRMRDDQQKRDKKSAKRDKSLDKKIADIERKLELVSLEITRQGETMATMEQHCRNRLAVCAKHKRTEYGDSCSAIGEEEDVL